MLEKEQMKEETEDHDSLDKKSGLNSYVSESNRLSKFGAKTSAGKNFEHKTASKLSHDVTNAMSQNTHTSPKERARAFLSS